jgi:hypothetical protein
MPALKPTNFKAVIKWIGRVEDRDAGLRSEPLRSVRLGLDGMKARRMADLRACPVAVSRASTPKAARLRMCDNSLFYP